MSEALPAIEYGDHSEPKPEEDWRIFGGFSHAAGYSLDANPFKTNIRRKELWQEGWLDNQKYMQLTRKT